MILLAAGLNLFDTCQLFLIPATIFFGALGVARTEMLKAAISLLGSAVSVLWCFAMFLEFDEGIEVWWYAFCVSLFFLLTWLACFIAHVSLEADQRYSSLRKSSYWRSWISQLRDYDPADEVENGSESAEAVQ